MKSVILIVILCLANVIYIFGDEHCNVNIKSGLINGRKRTVEGRELKIFLGIPYAQPPIGSLRFRKPLPVDDIWEPIDAIHFPDSCYQTLLPHTTIKTNLSEDCLYLNVWSPLSVNETDVQNLKPVMFLIHGGGLIRGASSEYYYNGEILAAKGDVVVVSINYRLGALGFFYAGTEEAPGNVGLWDQALALEWVRDNINHFGGDPNRITIFGVSSGGWSVSLHLLSPITRNLFRNAIIMSGAADNTFIANTKEAKQLWLKAAKLFECADSDGESGEQFTPKVIDCLLAANATHLSDIRLLSLLNAHAFDSTKLVTIDGHFLPDAPNRMLESGDFKSGANVMVSSTGDEGSTLLNFLGVLKHEVNMTYDEAYQELSNIAGNTSVNVNKEDVSRIYFTGISRSSEDYDLLRRTVGIAFGDYMITCPVLNFAEAIVKKDRERSRVYQYYYDSKLGIDHKAFCCKWMGVCHGHDIWPVFGLPFQGLYNTTDEEKDESAQVIEFFAHFAKHGKPSPQNGVEWQSYYLVSDYVIRPYLTLTNNADKRVSYIRNGLKTIECEFLWRKY